MNMSSVVTWLFLLAVALSAFNALVMVASPRVWSKLPGWLRVRGVVPMPTAGSAHEGRQIRFVGAFMLGGVLLVAFLLLTGRLKLEGL